MPYYMICDGEDERVMKKCIAYIFVIAIVLTLVACTTKEAEPYVSKTYEKTPEEKVEEYTAASTMITTVTHYEISDGTWKTDDYIYKYRLELTGTWPSSEVKCTYVVLSNTADITFDEAWKSSGFSSNLRDYFDQETARIVGYRLYQ